MNKLKQNSLRYCTQKITPHFIRSLHPLGCMTEEEGTLPLFFPMILFLINAVHRWKLTLCSYPMMMILIFWLVIINKNFPYYSYYFLALFSLPLSHVLWWLATTMYVVPTLLRENVLQFLSAWSILSTVCQF